MRRYGKDFGGVSALVSALYKNWKLSRLDLRYNNVESQKRALNAAVKKRSQQASNTPLELLL
jgi:hypothetical protein